MTRTLRPVVRQSLTDDLANRIRDLIRTRGLDSGDRLPSIEDMARQLGVGHPTLREALKKLETVGIVTIRHGSGVYVGRDDNSLLISNPVFSGEFTQKLLVDLIEGRMPIELTAVRLAAANATPDDLRQMDAVLTRAGECIDDDAALSQLHMAFHRAIAKASGNMVLSQMLEVLTKLFQAEQQAICRIYGRRGTDHLEHIQIYEALAKGDADLAVERMQAHLEGVRDVLLGKDQ